MNDSPVTIVIALVVVAVLVLVLGGGMGVIRDNAAASRAQQQAALEVAKGNRAVLDAQASLMNAGANAVYTDTQLATQSYYLLIVVATITTFVAVVTLTALVVIVYDKNKTAKVIPVPDIVVEENATGS